jgi:hypothetical protein
MIELVFWLAAMAVAYTWVGYPVLLAVLRRRRRPTRSARRRLPRLTVLVAAYNEATCIAAKLRSTLTQRYPWDQLEVIVVSDGSTDATDTIVAHYPDQRVRLLRQETRSGKSLALNRAVAVSHGEILVFTDANALFAPDALLRLAAPFADPAVGLVSGQGLYVEGRPGSAGSAPSGTGVWGAMSGPPIRKDAPVVSNGYVRYEAVLRAGEAALGTMAGADGAIYALRRSYYRELDGAQVNDLLHPIQVALAGAESRFVPEAYTVEPPSHGGAQEFRRHVRMIAQGVLIARTWLPRLVAARRWRAVWMIVSHRVLRWSTALALTAMLASNIALADSGPLYVATLAGQAAFYLLAAAGWLAERRGHAIGKLALPYYFCVVSAAGIAGIVRFLRSGAESVWAPAGQAPVTERAA